MKSLYWMIKIMIILILHSLKIHRIINLLIVTQTSIHININRLMKETINTRNELRIFNSILFCSDFINNLINLTTKITLFPPWCWIELYDIYIASYLMKWMKNRRNTSTSFMVWKKDGSKCDCKYCFSSIF